MNLNITPDDSGVVIVALDSENLDAGNVADFRAAVSGVLEEYSKAIFDMSSVKFVDSSGLGALLSCLRVLEKKHGELRLCGLNKPVRALFELVRMHRIFDIYNDREEALRASKS